MFAPILIALAVTVGPDQPHPAPGEVVIRFVTPPTEADLTALSTELTRLGASPDAAARWTAPPHAPHALGNPSEPHPLSYYRVAHVDERADVAALAHVLGAMPRVDFAVPNAQPRPDGFPSDPRFDEQWSHEKINSLAGWAYTTGSSDVIVGVVDTGCRITHEDLADNIWVNDDPFNGVDDDGNGFIDDTYGWDFDRGTNDIKDVYGHGTQASSIVGAGVDNAVGIAGLGNVTVMVAKWWHSSGSDMSVAESVYYAVDNGARVLNLSLGCQCEMPLSEAAINYAYDHGVLVVCSAGNAATSAPGYPAGYEHAMAISAITQSDTLASFSNYGPHIDVAAPSPGILTCSHTSDTGYDPGFGGTSAAAPHVAGLAGLVLSADPSLTHDEVRALINDHAMDVGSPGFDIQFGHGRIDVDATLAATGGGCDADIDGDGSVGVSDLLQLLADWGGTGASDVDGDGVVGVSDLLIVLAEWGAC